MALAFSAQSFETRFTLEGVSMYTRPVDYCLFDVTISMIASIATLARTYFSPSK